MKFTRRSMLALALLFAAAPFAHAVEVEIVPDVVYGHKDGMALTFDVLRPSSGGNGAGVLYMVSGGWVSRHSPPADSVTRFRALLDKGFTMFIVRHGSSPKYLIPEIVADVRLATRFIKFNAKKWNVDPDRLGAFGGSAGGHLALMVGMAPDEGDPAAAQDFMRSGNRIAAVVAYYPPTNISTWARGLNASGTTRFPALNFEREKAPAYSPILFVTADDPPTLLIHGDADDLVPVAESHRMFETLQKSGIRSEKVILPGAGHGFRGADAEKASALMLDWFERTLIKR